jgi:hypothetical protein
MNLDIPRTSSPEHGRDSESPGRTGSNLDIHPLDVRAGNVLAMIVFRVRVTSRAQNISGVAVRGMPVDAGRRALDGTAVWVFASNAFSFPSGEEEDTAVQKILDLEFCPLPLISVEKSPAWFTYELAEDCSEGKRGHSSHAPCASASYGLSSPRTTRILRRIVHRG